MTFLEITRWLTGPIEEREPLPEIYRECAHPQSVWFDIHWRPRFEKMQTENAALIARLNEMAECLDKAVAATKDDDLMYEDYNGLLRGLESSLDALAKKLEAE